MKTMKLWRKVLLQALFYFCSFMAIICLLNMVFSDGIDDWQGEIIKGSLYTVTIIIFNNWKEIKENIWKKWHFGELHNPRDPFTLCQTFKKATKSGAQKTISHQKVWSIQ